MVVLGGLHRLDRGHVVHLFSIWAVLITPSINRMSIALLASSRLMPSFVASSGADTVFV